MVRELAVSTPDVAALAQLGVQGRHVSLRACGSADFQLARFSVCALLPKPLSLVIRWPEKLEGSEE